MVAVKPTTAAYIRQSAIANNDNSGTTLTATFGSNVLAGSSLVAFVGGVSLGTTTLSDGLNGTWPSVLKSQAAGSIYNIQLFGIANTAAGACTVSFVPGAAVTFRSMEILEIANADTTAPFLANNSNSQATPGLTTDAVTSGSISYSDGHHLIVGMGGNPEQDVLPAAGTGYTSLETWGLTDGACRTEYKYETTGTSATATFTAGNNSTHLAFVLAVLEQSSTHNYTASPSETVTISESLNDGTNTKASAVQGVSETVTLTEVLAGGTPFSAGVSETVTITDAIAGASATQYTANVAEAVTITESIGAIRAAVAGLSETVTITEAVTGTSTGTAPNYGVNAQKFIINQTAQSSATTAPPVNSQASGSAFMIASAVGIDNIFDGATPAGVLSDNKSNAYSWLAAKIDYPNFANSGTRSGIVFNGTGGTGHTATTTFGTNDECTMFLVELLNVTRVQDHQQNQPAASSTTFTTAPATSTQAYVAVAVLWYEDFYTSIALDSASTAAGWHLLQQYEGTTNSIQGAIAARQGSTAETTSCTFVMTGASPLHRAITSTTIFQGASGTQYTASPAESITIADTVGAAITYTIAIGETVSLSESVAQGLLLPAAVSESVTLTDALAVVCAAVAAIAEILTISEATAQTFSVVVATSESITLTDSTTSQALNQSGIAESVTLTDALGNTLAAGTTLAETVTFTELLGALVSLSNAVGESVTLSELLLTGIPYPANVTETLAISDFVASIESGLAGVNEAVTIADGIGINFPFTAVVSETIVLNEAVSPKLTALGQPSEFLSIAENVGLSTAPANVSETITISDSQAVSLSTPAALAEAVTLTESLTVNQPASAQVAETILWSDAVQSGSQQNYSVGLQETLVFAESMNSATTLQVNQSDAFAIADTLAGAAVIPATVSEQFNVNEALASALAAGAQLQEAFSTTPTLADAEHASAQVAEAFLFSEVIRTQSSALGLSETWLLSDSISVSVPFSGLPIGVSHKAGAGRVPIRHSAGKWRPPWYHKK